MLSTRIKDANVALRHSRGCSISTLQGPEKVWRGWTPVGTRHKREVAPKKNDFSAIKTCVEDVRQGQQIGPDLLESIMTLTRLVKEELRRILLKIGQFSSEVAKFRLQLFGFRKSDGFPPEANASLLASKF